MLVNTCLIGKLNRLIGTLLLMICAACTTTSYDHRQSNAPVEDKIIIDGNVMPLPEQPGYQVEALATQPRMSPVVSQLLIKAEGHRRNQNWQASANALERALRIEPRNAVLWNRLADVRYSQENWQQAIQLAAKSNTLVKGNDTVQRQNWFLMVNAYEALGKQASAQRYRDKLKIN